MVRGELTSNSSLVILTNPDQSPRRECFLRPRKCHLSRALPPPPPPPLPPPTRPQDVRSNSVTTSRAHAYAYMRPGAAISTHDVARPRRRSCRLLRAAHGSDNGCCCCSALQCTKAPSCRCRRRRARPVGQNARSASRFALAAPDSRARARVTGLA